ncbi:hypothetical protein LTR10_023365 [Elasticomyces elasticus]|uniref:Fumarylacetoacetase-like C-terminal domain-containing protein n=1 Tax=Exophiala sideris TaxID=1016849 RepID=A0ABR0IW09_9EURO|nr:hypothetical protein LTR10_023365 [Elasticomyces elasticus]KAK5023152.1 hypothetical protein LTR13_011296 [Exophiala sideris]KAK5023374.1 hypothetical protein LTS07_009249 [Exophiala sideris]KAK5048736.1 hypothetical protein LTR69_011327 [Exophiala sideris]KAK5176138.1 hypothetical protein LTR44_011317 [Eurotiomycetes sp. CCFEE 6388]
MTWARLIRFTDDSGRTTFGDPCIGNCDDLITLLNQQELFAIRLLGNDPFALARTTEKIRVRRLLAVLTEDDVAVIKCIGLNYRKHIAETGRKPPPYPSLFMKPAPAIAGFNSDISVAPIAQDKNLDYEGELAVVIGETGKNISVEDAISYVAGYASSNDVSARTWQRDPAFAGSVPQWSYAKSFDSFAPLGPMLVSPSVAGAADHLRLQTLVNGEIRQDSNTADLLFDVAHLVSFLSQGSTLQRGTVIMTGTPDGVALGMPDPKPWLQHGDVVEVRIELLGSCVNKVVYESTEPGPLASSSPLSDSAADASRM